MDDSQSLHRKWLFHQTSIFNGCLEPQHPLVNCTSTSTNLRRTFDRQKVFSTEIAYPNKVAKCCACHEKCKDRITTYCTSYVKFEREFPGDFLIFSVLFHQMMQNSPKWSSGSGRSIVMEICPMDLSESQVPEKQSPKKCQISVMSNFDLKISSISLLCESKSFKKNGPQEKTQNEEAWASLPLATLMRFGMEKDISMEMGETFGGMNICIYNF